MSGANREALDRERASRAGCEVLRRARSTGTLVGLYRADLAGMDQSGGLWVTLCEEHGCLCNHETRPLADRHLPYPRNWCEQCSE